MAESGCWQIAYGVETGSERIMKWLQKKITFEQIERAMRWTYDAGINTKGFFILGHPTESRQTLEETVQLTAEWYRHFYENTGSPKEKTLSQIREYESVAQQRDLPSAQPP